MDTLNSLINALRCLPGVGPKSAQRMAFHLLHKQRQRGLHLASCLSQAMNRITHCEGCNNYTEHPLCTLCLDPKRSPDILCVVENPVDVLAIEQSQSFNGRYFVLMGKVSPIDGLGPEDIGLPKLKALVQSRQIKEVILALSPSVESHTTAHFIHQLLAQTQVNISQVAHGIPSGGELEFLDGHTIGSALRNRALINA